MELTNHTALPATVFVNDVEGLPARVGVITAKATFTFDASGRTELDTQCPFPLFSHDQATDLGLLPPDHYPRRDPAFEVILLGCAYAGRSGGVTKRTVRLTVGSTTREIAVFGDRVWVDRHTISEPSPFERMPITYERAFGGRCDAYLDPDSPVEISDPINKCGRGFDAEAMALGLSQAFRLPPGMPQLDYERRLPNLEDPAALITRWEDAPKPACWATVPADCGLYMLRQVQRLSGGGTIDSQDDNGMVEQVYQRAHPDWILPLPTRGSEVCLEGVTPEDRVAFPLPSLRVLADYAFGMRTGVLELVPHLLVLLPEQARFYIVYRATFTVEYEVGSERCFRLRTAPGWYDAQTSPARDDAR